MIRAAPGCGRPVSRRVFPMMHNARRGSAALRAADRYVCPCGQVGRNTMKKFLRWFAIGVGAWTAAASAHADCFDEAAKYQKVNPLILRAIAWQESHNQPDAMNKNANGSIDY